MSCGGEVWGNETMWGEGAGGRGGPPPTPTCVFQSPRFDKYSPTTLGSKPGVRRRNSAMDSGVAGLTTKPKLCRADMLLEGSPLNVRAASVRRRFCSFLRCNSVAASEVLSASARLRLKALGSASVWEPPTARHRLHTM